MKVNELIERLKQFNPEAMVVVSAGGTVQAPLLVPIESVAGGKKVAVLLLQDVSGKIKIPALEAAGSR